MSGRTIGLVGWGVVFAAFFAWQGMTLMRQGDGWLTLSRILEVAGDYAVVRWALVAAWLWFGWHVFVRTWEVFPPT